MSLIDDVRAVCERLGPHGWAGLFAAHGLDITAPSLERELARELPGIRRDLKGFEDFALEGKRGIEPGHPARSLLYHALASPAVLTAADGTDLREFPTLTELDAVENYLYGAQPPTLQELRERAGAADLAIVVFAHEYRPADHTCHKRHADLVFSRTGVARIGTAPALYVGKHRGFLPAVEEDPFGIRALPARYAAYIAVKRRGSEAAFCPMRFQRVGSELAGETDMVGDARRDFWQPIHKLFSGPECLRGLGGDLKVTLTAHHVNDKIRRIHHELSQPATPGAPPRDTGIQGRDTGQFPFHFEEGIAELAQEPSLGMGTLVPAPHPLVEPARDTTGNLISFLVPANNEPLSSSFSVSGKQNDARHAPEFVHARRRLEADGSVTDLNTLPDVSGRVAQGGYRALHFVDHTGDGWVEAVCPQLAAPGLGLKGSLAAYSLVTAPDFFPSCDQRELTEWAATLPVELRDRVWQVPPLNLSDMRFPANLQLPKTRFTKSDTTVTSIVSLFGEVSHQQTNARPADVPRHSHLPDDAAGVFAPGWDVSRDSLPDGTLHLAAYGLGSPFPEDAKLCAALSTFWPAVAPDATRGMTPDVRSITVSPLTDEEIGIVGNLAWDGTPGPREIQVGNQAFAEYASFAYVDYVETALEGRFCLALTSHVDLEQYQNRVLAMALVYQALGGNRRDWLLLSFRPVTPGDPELVKAQQQAQATLPGAVFRFELFANDTFVDAPSGFRRRRVKIRNRHLLFADPANRRVLMRRPDGPWRKAIG